MAETVLNQSAQFGFLDVSASNVFGQVGSAITVYFGVKQLRSEDGDERNMPWAENSWLELAAFVPYPSEAVG